MIPLMRVTAVILVLLLILPPVFTLLFGHAFGTGGQGDVAALLEDQDRSPASVDFVNQLKGETTYKWKESNWGGEPFTTRFVFRKAGGAWGGFYVGHQDWYWANCRARLDTNAHVAMFYRGTNILLTFDWVEETCWRPQRGAVTGPQFRLPPGWSPRGEDRW